MISGQHSHFNARVGRADWRVQASARAPGVASTLGHIRSVNMKATTKASSITGPSRSSARAAVMRARVSPSQDFQRGRAAAPSHFVDRRLLVGATGYNPRAAIANCVGDGAARISGPRPVGAAACGDVSRGHAAGPAWTIVRVSEGDVSAIRRSGRACPVKQIGTEDPRRSEFYDSAQIHPRSRNNRAGVFRRPRKTGGAASFQWRSSRPRHVDASTKRSRRGRPPFAWDATRMVSQVFRLAERQGVRPRPGFPCLQVR